MAISGKEGSLSAGVAVRQTRISHEARAWLTCQPQPFEIERREGMHQQKGLGLQYHSADDATALEILE